MTSTTVDALKALYVAFGGTATDVANLNVIPDVINAIAGLDFFTSIKNIEKITSVLSVTDNKLTVNASGGITMTAANDINISATGPTNRVILQSEGGSVNMTAAMSSVTVDQTHAAVSSGTNGVNIYDSKNEIQIDTSGNIKLSAIGGATLNNKNIATTT